MKFLHRSFSTGFKFAPTILFIGAPGVGKGTYSKLLSKEFKIPEFSTGDELRKLTHQTNLSPQLQEIKQILHEGHLVNDDYMIELVKHKLEQPEFSKGVILDGFPRNLSQAKRFQEIRKIDIVINVLLNQEVLIKKMLGRRVCSCCAKSYNVCDIKENGYDMEPLLPKKDVNKCDNCDIPLEMRDDDTDEIIRERLKVYNSKMEEFVGFYKSQGSLYEFEGKRGVKDFDKLKQIFVNHFKL